jgi:acyl-CoA thioesterase-1
MLRRIIFAFVLLFSSTTFAETKLLVLGDSLSAGYGLTQGEGWVDLLQNTYENANQPIKLINASISGETTQGGLQRLPALLSKYQPNWVLIELGGNDGLRGYSIKQLQANLEQLVTLSKQAGANVLLMEIEITPNLGPRYSKMFKQSYIKVAEKHEIATIPFFIRDIVLKPELMQNDQIHPNKQAQPILAEIMYKAFTPHIN